MSMLKLEGAEPLYRQLTDLLRRLIQNRDLKADEPIPSERSLCETHGISRITVRQALSELINEGLLYKRHGKGTYVAKKKVSQGLVRFVNFARTVGDLGMNPSTKIVSYDVLPPELQVAKVLDIELTDRVGRLCLLGMGDNEPFVVYESYFPLPLAARMAREAEEMEKEGVAFSTYDLYGKDGIATPSSVVQTFEAQTPDDALAAMLKVKKTAAVFVITSLFRTPDNRPTEFRKAAYRGDRYKFHLTREFA